VYVPDEGANAPAATIWLAINAPGVLGFEGSLEKNEMRNGSW
jgi:hypothetical protein